MNYVKQAYELSEVKKQHALDLYKKSVSELVHKDYVFRVNDAHTELSAIFGQQWLYTQRSSGKFWADSALYAEANVAFNYANFNLGIEDKFTALAKELVADEVRISDSEIKAMSKQMNSILTATTTKKVERKLMGV
jgi:hypothetical protein